MPSTALMGYTIPTDNTEAGTWGSDVNTNFTSFVDVNFAGLTTLALSASNVTLTAAQARTQTLRLTGTLLANVIIDAGANLWNGIRCVENLTTGNFTVTLSYNGTFVVPQTRRMLVFLDTSNGPRAFSMAGSGTADPIPSGNSVLFPQASAPAGWTQNVGLTDYALRLVNGAGGGTTGSINFSTLFATTATQAYTLQIADIPNHGHPFRLGATISGNDFVNPSGGLAMSNTEQASEAAYNGAVSGTVGQQIGGTGGGGSHSHNLDMRVKYVDIISAVRT